MPVTDPTLVAWVAAKGIPAFPGAMTPTEALSGWMAGAAGSSSFPHRSPDRRSSASSTGPFPEIPVIPTGGVTVDTAANLIIAGAVAVGIGKLAHRRTGDQPGIAERGRRVMRVIKAARDSGRIG